jgi:hypothetical protein
MSSSRHKAKKIVDSDSRVFSPRVLALHSRKLPWGGLHQDLVWCQLISYFVNYVFGERSSTYCWIVNIWVSLLLSIIIIVGQHSFVGLTLCAREMIVWKLINFTVSRLPTSSSVLY